MVKNPSHPMPFLPASLSELRLWVKPRPDGGADLFAESDAPDDEGARIATRQVHQLLLEMNSLGVKLVTRGVLNDAEVTHDGPTVKLHLTASQDQLEALYDLVAAYLGVNEPTAPGAASAAPPSVPPRAPAPPQRPAHPK